MPMFFSLLQFCIRVHDRKFIIFNLPLPSSLLNNLHFVQWQVTSVREIRSVIVENIHPPPAPSFLSYIFQGLAD